jgi:DNA-binding NarL/FixJ family response regulator
VPPNFSCPDRKGRLLAMGDAHKTILLVEDKTIVREGLRLIVSADPEYTIAGEAEDGYQAIALAEQLMPDLILMDLSMPRMNGMEAIRSIKKKCPGAKILVLTVHDSEEFILAALHAGADGYVVKEANRSELMLAIKNVLRGKNFISPSIADKVITGYLENRQGVKAASAFDSLTGREREILKLIAEGHKNREIAQQLYISIKTVEKHRENLMSKLNLHSLSEIITFAFEKGILSTEKNTL